MIKAKSFPKIIFPLLLIIVVSLGLQLVISLRNKIPDHDEAVYWDLAQTVLRGKLPIRNNLEQTICVETSPLTFLLIDVGLLFFPSLFGARLAGSIFSLLTVILTYLLAKLFWPKENSRFISLSAAALLAWHPLFTSYSHSVYIEPFFTPILLLAIYFITLGLVTKNKRNYFLAGLFLFLAGLTKFLIIGIALGLIIFYFWQEEQRLNFKQLIFLLVSIGVGLVLWPIVGQKIMPGFMDQFLFFFNREFLGKNNPDLRVSVSLVRYLWGVILALSLGFFLVNLAVFLDWKTQISLRQKLLVSLLTGWSILVIATGVKETRFWYPLLPLLAINASYVISRFKPKVRLLILLLIIINYFLVFRGVNLYYWRIKLTSQPIVFPWRLWNNK